MVKGKVILEMDAFFIGGVDGDIIGYTRIASENAKIAWQYDALSDEIPHQGPVKLFSL